MKKKKHFNMQIRVVRTPPCTIVTRQHLLRMFTDGVGIRCSDRRCVPLHRGQTDHQVQSALEGEYL